MSYPVEYNYQVLDSGIPTAVQQVRLDIMRALLGAEGAAGFNDDAQPVKVAEVLTAFAEPLVAWVLNGPSATSMPPQQPDGDLTGA